ncbi:MAG: collagen binding domain-containing protein, partial [Vicinamibacterales bacterium]
AREADGSRRSLVPVGSTFGTSQDGAWFVGRTAPDSDHDSVTGYEWESSCGGPTLVGAKPDGAYPRLVLLADPADSLPPQTTPAVVPIGAGLLQVTFNAVDAGSGVKGIMVRRETAPIFNWVEEAPFLTITVPDVGPTTLTFQAVDHAGNHEPAQTIIVGALPPPPPPPSPGHLAVTVADEVTALPLSGVTVQIFSGVSGALVASGTTGGDGVFTSPDLVAGPYRVRTVGTPGYRDEIYNDIPCDPCIPSSGALIDVAAGATVPVTFSLAPPGSIAGAVTSSSSGTAIADVVVSVFDQNGAPVATGTTDATGAYAVAGLAVGQYYLRTTNSQGFIDELFNNISCALGCATVASGDAVTVAAAAATTVDFALLPSGGGIAGFVREEGTGTPLAGVVVDVFDEAGDPVASAVTTDDGEYLTGDVPTGNYFVRTANTQGYLDELFDNIGCAVGCEVTTGTVVTHTAGVTGGFADFDLSKGARISGTVAAAGGGPLEGVAVRVHTAAGAMVTTATTDAAGHYQTGAGLPEGFYVVRTVNDAGYVDELFDDIACVIGCDVTLGTPISAAVTGTAAHVSDIHFVLTPNSPVGTDVVAVPSTPTGETPATVTFGAVTATGLTTITESATGPAVPAGFQLGEPPIFYDIQTTATVVSPIDVCLSYAPGAFPAGEPVRMLHHEGGAWVDVTTSHDESTRTVCGRTTHLSPFVLVSGAPPPPPDVVPPVLSCSVSPAVLWPPNGALVPVSASVVVTDSGSGPAGFTLLSVTSSEPGAGDIAGWDIGTPDLSGQLRAKRSGKKGGRVYRLTYQGRDVAGNTATCQVSVTVPHDQGKDDDESRDDRSDDRSRDDKSRDGKSHDDKSRDDKSRDDKSRDDKSRDDKGKGSSKESAPPKKDDKPQPKGKKG